MFCFELEQWKNKIKFVIWLLILLLLLRGLLSWLLLLFVRNDFLVVVVVILDDDGACEIILDLPILFKLVFVVALLSKLLFGGGKMLSGVTFVVLLEELVPCVRWLDGVDVVWIGVVLALEELVVPVVVVVVVGVFVSFCLSIETKGEMRRDWFDGPRGAFCGWVINEFGSTLGKSLENLIVWLEFLLDFSAACFSLLFWSYNLNAPLSFVLNENKIKT